MAKLIFFSIITPVFSVTSIF